MPKKRVRKKRQAATVHFERVTLERVMEIVQAGVPKRAEAASDSVVGESAAKTEPSAARHSPEPDE